MKSSGKIELKILLRIANKLFRVYMLNLAFRNNTFFRGQLHIFVEDKDHRHIFVGGINGF